MEKIKLKAWHKILIFSVLGVLILLAAISLFRGKPETEKKPIPVASKFRIDIMPSDSCFSMFDDEVIKGDTIAFEIIEGDSSGWIFQVFCVGQRLDYTLSIDLRNSDHVWKKGDIIILDSDSLKTDKREVSGNKMVEITSNYKTGYNSYLTDKVEFPDYRIEIRCTRFDSLAAFSGNFQATKKQLDGPGSKNTMFVKGNFRADAIKIGKRIIN